jgi:hypothetical protein
MQNIFAKMKRIAAQRDESKPRVLTKGDLLMPAVYDMTDLRRELPSLRLDRRFALRSDAKEQAFQVERISKALQDIQATFSSWNWYAHKVTGPSINTARLIVPDDIAGAVVLDATAGTSLAYRLFEDRVDVIPVPAKARSYENVTLHVSRGHRTGRGHWEQEATNEAPKFLAAVHETIGREHSVLAVCHLGAKAAFVGLAPEFQRYAVGTYGALDGRNDWADFDTVAICGLDHRDDVWADNTFMALQGVQSNEWLQSGEARAFKEYPDIRKALHVGELATSTIQAINRVRCRRTIDSEGNCGQTNVFLLLPAGKKGEAILSLILREMPGAVVEEWQHGEAKTKVRRSNHVEAIVAFAQAMGPRDRISATDLKARLGITSSTTWERLTKELRDHANDLCQRLLDHGVQYVVEGKGRGARSSLVRG